MLKELCELLVVDAEQLGIDIVDLGRAVLDTKLIVDLLSGGSVEILSCVGTFNFIGNLNLVCRAISDSQSFELAVKVEALARTI